MAEEENFGGWGGFFKLGGFVGKDFAGKAVFARDVEGVGALLPRRVERVGAEDGDGVFGVHGDGGGWEKDRGAIGAADEDVGLATVAKSLQDMGGREEVPLFADEEAVAKEAVVVAARGGGLVQLIVFFF